ncbi:MAG: DNA polymerase IV [Bdellovibrionales bacterium]|nr:DNA polymerase IV [Bdellovibrionales bacterium]
MVRRLIGHLDADCFYVSCERVRQHSLRGKAVGVLGNQGACVIAKSYEMKAAGVKTGVPIWEAVDLCPNGIFIKRDFRWYEVLSRMMLEIMQSVSPQVEYYSIDEFFFDCSALTRVFRADLEESAFLLQQRILKEVGVPVSLGISRSKLLAKLASDAEKPFGYKVLLSPEGIRDYLAKQPVGELWGIGRQNTKKLHRYGIRTCLQLADAHPKLIRKLLTITGERILFEINGCSVLPIVTERAMHKNVARGGSIGGASRDPKKVYAWLVRNVERLIEALDVYGYVCGAVTLILSFARDRFAPRHEPSWFQARTVLPQHTANSKILLPAFEMLLYQARLSRPVTHMHLIASDLAMCGREQLPLFPYKEREEDRAREAFWRSGAKQDHDALKRMINEKFGRFALRNAETLELREMYRDSAHSYDICDIYGKSCF